MPSDLEERSCVVSNCLVSKGASFKSEVLRQEYPDELGTA